MPGQAFDPSQSGLVVGLMNWKGSIDTWDIQIIDTNLLIYGTNYLTRDKEYRGELVKRDDLGVFQWTTPDRLIYTFRHPQNSPQVMKGRLLKIQDFNGNSVQLQWNVSIGVLTQVVDSVSGTYRFNYNAGYLLTNVTYGQWQVNFAYDTTNRLNSKSLANSSGLYGGVNTTWQFQYGTNGLLSRIVDPQGNTNLFVQYDKYGRQTNQVDALNRATVTRYGVPDNRQITRVDPATNSWIETYDRKGHILAQQDPLTNITSYAYDGNGNRISVTEPLGWITTLGYDNRANVIAKTNALTEITTWTFHPFFNKPTQQVTQQPADASGRMTWTNFYAYDGGGNLTNNSDGLGTLVNYTYFTNGRLATSTDANSHKTSFTYDTNGFLFSKTDAGTNTTTHVVNDVGWKLHEEDALGNPATYTYNLNGNVTRIQDVLSRIFNKVYDANGNLLFASDGKGVVTTFAYDPANQKTNMVDRTGTNKWNYFYTTRGMLDHATDALGYSATNFYDAANRLIRASDPLGQSITNQYDPNGNLIVFFDKLGQRWVKTYDRLNRVASEADPLGDTRATTYDIADRVQQITSPNNYPSTHTYDGRGHLTQWIDPQNFYWLYAYDGVGNITNITDALTNHYIMTYGPRNERLLEQNQDTNIWQYTYDELLRLKQQTDPNDTVRTPTYDNAGRVLFVDFSTGRRDSFVYDDNNNPKSISRRIAGVTTALQLIYDPLDRVTEQDDALGKTVLYGYDALSRNTSLTYPGGKVLTNSFDALGRLTNQVDWANRQMNYSYDAADRLKYRAYPNGVVQTNAFDSAGRLNGLSYSTPNVPPTTNPVIQVALTYAYDRNGNKTGGGESGTFNWPLPSLTDDNSRFTPAGKLIDRKISQLSTNNSQLNSTITYNYDSSGNMTNASGNGQSWTLKYDEDNRTTAINWDAGITSKHITNRYDALGRRISKNVDGVTTGYVLSLAGGMEKILCDLDSGGNVTAWYVHGPDLCYKVNVTNGLTCYHADAMANIIALTDGNTNLVAQYAYTPYGRSLGSTNFLSSNSVANPYLFVGAQGVMEEIPGLYFMRARYYSSDAGVFLSTDPVKNIGPGWKPITYWYAIDNPLNNLDPTGNYVEILDRASSGARGTFGPLGLTVAGDASRSEGFSGQITQTMGLGVDAGASATLLGVYPGNRDDWNDYDALELNLWVISPVLLHNPDGKNGHWGFEINGNVGVGFGLFGSRVQKNTESGGGGSSGSQTTSSKTVATRTTTVAAPKALATKSATPANPSGGSSGGTTTGGGGGNSTYTVKAGDTLGNIGSQFGSNAKDIGAANGIKDLNKIYVGQKITVPAPRRK